MLLKVSGNSYIYPECQIYLPLMKKNYINLIWDIKIYYANELRATYILFIKPKDLVPRNIFSDVLSHWIEV